MIVWFPTDMPASVVEARAALSATASRWSIPPSSPPSIAAPFVPNAARAALVVSCEKVESISVTVPLPPSPLSIAPPPLVLAVFPENVEPVTSRVP